MPGSSNETAKRNAALLAVKEIRDGMVVGLGTGSTAKFAIEAIGQLVKKGCNIRAVASSLQSEKLARGEGIPLIDSQEFFQTDLYIDGADAIDPSLNLVKGGGGALVREKILANASSKFIVIATEEKFVSNLSTFPLPVEIVPFAYPVTLSLLQKENCTVIVRMKEGKMFFSDNGNIIVDCSFQNIQDPGSLNRRLNEIPGVVECGLFPASMVSMIIKGKNDGSTDVIKIS